jgi:penicillin-binding protein 1A
MMDATVAIEDKRFFDHKGVDFEGIVRAALKNLENRETVQGGSTLTMQLVKNLYEKAALQRGAERTLKVKIQEAKLAEDLENEHPGREGKNWILTKYINNVPYGTVGGQTAVGVAAAARVFFDKPANDLTLAESALLAGLPQAPSQYSPFRNPGQARARRNQVLTAME